MYSDLGSPPPTPLRSFPIPQPPNSMHFFLFVFRRQKQARKQIKTKLGKQTNKPKQRNKQIKISELRKEKRIIRSCDFH